MHTDNLSINFLGRTTKNKLIYEACEGSIRIRQSFTDSFTQEELTNSFKKAVEDLKTLVNHEYRNLDCNEQEKFEYYASHPSDSRTKRINSVFSSTSQSAVSVNQPKAQTLTQEEFVKILDTIGKTPRNPNEKINFLSILTQLGYPPTLENIQFDLQKITVNRQRGLGRTLPSWGTNLLKEIDFSGIRCNECHFRYVNLSKSNFKDCVFEKCYLAHTNFEKAKISSTTFNSCQIHDAIFDQADMRDTVFKDCNLNYASFSGAQLKSVSFLGEPDYSSMKHQREILFSNKDLTQASYTLKLDGCNFLNAHVTDCKIVGSDITDTLFYNADKSGFLLSCPPPSIQKPLIAELWNNQQPGYSATKLQFALKQELIPIKYNYKLSDIDKQALDSEVKQLLVEVKNSSLPIPQALIQTAKINPARFPNVKLIIDKAKELTTQVHAVVLPGGADVEPEFFGQERKADVHHCEKNYRRSLFEFAIIHHAQLQGMPLMGICRGTQMINVYCGGTLHPVSNQRQKSQSLKVEEEGIIRSVLGNNVRVFSCHNHAIDSVAPGLKVKMQTEDVPKALESDQGAPVILTQFHPEFAGLAGKVANPGISNTNKNFWGMLATSAQAYARKKNLFKEQNASAKIQKTAQVSQKRSIDENHLLMGEEEIPANEYAWYLNSAMLRHAYEMAEDPEIKKSILCAANNYLAKTAPIQRRTKNMLGAEDYDTFFNLTPFPRHAYHRQTGFQRRDQDKSIKSGLALNHISPLLITDTTEISALFPNRFTVLNGDEDERRSIEKLTESIERHLAEFNQNGKALEKQLKAPLLFDFTNALAPFIKTNGKRSKDIVFENKFDDVKDRMAKLIEQSIQKIIQKNPSLDSKQLKEFIQNNTTTICQVEFEGFAGIKILPVFKNLCGMKSVHNIHNTFENFVISSGSFMGGVNYRRHILDSFAIRPDIEYAPQGPANVSYFPKRLDFLNQALMKRLKKAFSDKNLNKQKPYIHILGQSTIDLVTGLFNEITDDHWEQLNQDPGAREVIQTTLFKLQCLLATAEQHQDDFTQFSQAIELAHCELGILLEFLMPFQEEDFSTIYQKQLHNIPEDLKPLLRAGLGKTAMNTFTGINAAMMASQPQPVRCYNADLYYEETFCFGSNQKVEDVLNDSSIKNVDLYVCQFNPNINIDSDKTTYASRNIIEDIKNILDKKKDTKHLTVAVDCTIDYLNSPQNRKLLDHFKREIHEGKINFIFLRSGQKFDMLGMDNYFGSPFYIINNGGDQWRSFNQLFTSKAHRTDPLSLQWFCLSNRYAEAHIERYRREIFKKSRELLNRVPDKLKPRLSDPTQTIRVNSVVDDQMLVSFIDIKVRGQDHPAKAREIEKKFFEICSQEGVSVQSKPSFGFFIPNINRISGTTVTNLRINPGLDPKANVALSKFLQAIEQEIK